MGISNLVVGLFRLWPKYSPTAKFQQIAPTSQHKSRILCRIKILWDLVYFLKYRLMSLYVQSNVCTYTYAGTVRRTDSEMDGQWDRHKFAACFALVASRSNHNHTVCTSSHSQWEWSGKELIIVMSPCPSSPNTCMLAEVQWPSTSIMQQRIDLRSSYLDRSPSWATTRKISILDGHWTI